MNSFDAGYQPEPPAYQNTPQELAAARNVAVLLGADKDVMSMIFGNN